jgi:DNA-binding transcriptional LysR family regulator
LRNARARCERPSPCGGKPCFSSAAGEYSAPRGDLAMTAPIVFGRLHVLPIAIAFLKAYPDINIRIARG